MASKACTINPTHRHLQRERERGAFVRRTTVRLNRLGLGPVNLLDDSDDPILRGRNGVEVGVWAWQQRADCTFAPIVYINDGGRWFANPEGIRTADGGSLADGWLALEEDAVRRLSSGLRLLAERAVAKNGVEWPELYETALALGGWDISAARLRETKQAHSAWESEHGTDEDWAGWYARYLLGAPALEVVGK